MEFCRRGGGNATAGNSGDRQGEGRPAESRQNQGAGRRGGTQQRWIPRNGVERRAVEERGAVREPVYTDASPNGGSADSAVADMDTLVSEEMESAALNEILQAYDDVFNEGQMNVEVLGKGMDNGNSIEDGQSLRDETPIGKDNYTSPLRGMSWADFAEAPENEGEGEEVNRLLYESPSAMPVLSARENYISSEGSKDIGLNYTVSVTDGDASISDLQEITNEPTDLEEFELVLSRSQKKSKKKKEREKRRKEKKEFGGTRDGSGNKGHYDLRSRGKRTGQ